MKSLFQDPAREEILSRLALLRPDSTRLWGKMAPAQALAHCTTAVEMATGDFPRKQVLIGKLLGPFLKPMLLGEKPFGKNGPTDPAFIVEGARDFAKEKARLLATVGRFCEKGPAGVEGNVHSFLGPLTGAEWGVMMYKHLDHHLRQFGT
jgi:hypothetical protein